MFRTAQYFSVQKDHIEVKLLYKNQLQFPKSAWKTLLMQSHSHSEDFTF